MPKLPKGFGRRRSTANALDELEHPPVTAPSFRVFERPKEGNKSFDGGMTYRVQTAPLPPRKDAPARGKEENMFEDLKVNRGSGASNTNTVSTTDNSSRLSAASTAPSSASHRSHDEWKSPLDKPYSDIPVPPVPKPQPAFSLKAAGRTFSFGRGKSTPSPSQTIDENPSPTTPEDLHLSRPRAVTSSSYASTATPPKLDDQNLGLSMGGDFADMFSGFDKRKSAILNIEEDRAMSQTPEHLKLSPTVPPRSYVATRSNYPSPLNIDHSKQIEASPYSWTSQHSNDDLMGNLSPTYPPAPPPVPRHGSLQTSSPTTNGSSATRVISKPAAPADGLKRRSAQAVRRTSTYERDEVEDEDAKFLKESAFMISRLTEETPARARDTWMNPTATPSTGSSFNDRPSGVSGWRRDTPEATRRPVATSDNNGEENMFAQIGKSSVSTQRKVVGPNNTKQHTNGPTNRVMTPAQFERYRQDHDRRNSNNTVLKGEDNEEDAYEEDDEDEAEKQKQIAKQRRKQEAHMAVYRQQMMKVTGEVPTPAPAARPGMPISQSSPNLLRLGSPTPEDDEEDEEIPLAILAAHGFPNKSRQPTRLSSISSNPNLRASSQMGTYPPPSVSGDPTRLPVFARNLPQDPYFGAGLVNPSNRESLAFGVGAGSAYGGPSNALVPGGLVGVIATEERSRSMRRGSPNPAGGYGPPPPSNGFNGMGMPNMPRSMTMGSMNGIHTMGPMGPAQMLTPGDQAQMEMQQQMQQFMQMQMQFMQMMTTGGQGSQSRPQSQDGGVPTPQGLRPASSHQRAMSMLDPNSAPWQKQNIQRNTMFTPSIYVPGNQYAPSIAPSERSNVGLPGRYRPVSQYLGGDNKSRTASMSGAIQNLSDEKQSSMTIKPAKPSVNADDEDEEAAWAAMKQRREKKRSKWISKKDASGLNDLVGFTT